MSRAPVLVTSRLVLEPFSPEHVDALHRVFLEPGVRRFLLDDQEVPRAWVEAEVEESRRRFRERGAGLWTVRDRDDGEVVGFAGFREFHEPPELQLVFGLSEARWGTGLGEEVAWEVIRHGLETLGMVRILADADAGNTASIRLLERLGMRLRERRVKSGLDTVCYVLEGGGRAR